MRIKQETSEPSSEAASAASIQTASISGEKPALQPESHANGVGVVSEESLSGGRAVCIVSTAANGAGVVSEEGLGGGTPLGAVSLRGETATAGIFRLVATDLDGTLLRKGEIVSERTRQALQRVQEAGALVVLVSGRPPRSLRHIAEAAGVNGLAVCSNGAVIYDLEQDTILEHWPIQPEIVSQLIIQLREAAPGIVFGLEFGLRYGREPAYPMLRNLPPGFEVQTDDALILCQEPAVKLIAIHPELTTEALAELASRVGGETVLVTYSGVGFIEISAAGIHKAWALEKLCARLGIAASEVIAFGDMPNDLPMLAWAGHGIAMANAHPEVLQQAHEITLSNMEDGVAVVLERLLAAHQLRNL